MANAARRLAIRVKDALRYSRIVRRALGSACVLRDWFARPADSQAEARRIVQLCAAARLSADSRLVHRIERRICARLDRLDPARVDWESIIPAVSDRRMSKAAVIKPWVSAREKGVIFVSFEDQWARLLCGCDLSAFAARYDLVVAPTWCPPHSLVNVVFPRVYPAPFISTISNVKDLEILPRLSPKYVTVPLYASSWVNPKFYKPRPRNRRDVGVVMIANFGQYKRHHALFRAMRDMRRCRDADDVRAVLIGQSQGSRTAQTVRREAALYGVEDRISVHSSVTNEFLADALCRARVSLILSRREGSCVAVAESMFADTPVGMLADAEVGSKAFINDQTGRLLRGRHLAEDLREFLAAAGSMSPRAWAERNISCQQSTHELNAFLKAAALARGDAWTRDIETVYWRPDPQADGDDADGSLRRERQHLRDTFGLEVGDSPDDEPMPFSNESRADAHPWSGGRANAGVVPS